MCRTHRRCPGGTTDRERALKTARKRVERARRALRTARATGDTEAITAAEQRLTDARQNLADTHAAHPYTPNAPQTGGHDNGPTKTSDHATEHAPEPVSGPQHGGIADQDTRTGQGRGAKAKATKDTMTDDGRSGAGEPGDTTHTQARQFTNVNIATGNARVGSQRDIRTGRTPMTSEQINDRVQQAVARAQDAAARARAAGDRARRAASDAAGKGTTNVAGGHDRVHQQNGVNFGDVYIVNSRRSTGGDQGKDAPRAAKRTPKTTRQTREPGVHGGIGSIHATDSVHVVSGDSSVTYTAGENGDVTVTRHDNTSDDVHIGSIWVNGKRVQ